MDPKKCQLIFKRLEQANPTPHIELNYATPFELLIAVILSAHSTDKGVNKATDQLFPVANTPEAILDLGESGLKNYIKSIGLYNAKAKNIIQACRLLVGQHHSQVPQDRESLEQLPGVGRKTANVILNTIFDQPVIPVDTHIFRVANRTHLAVGKTPLEIEKQLMAIVPEPFKKRAHHWLVLHGRYVCVAKKPKCSHCVINDLCEYDQKCFSCE